MMDYWDRRLQMVLGQHQKDFQNVIQRDKRGPQFGDYGTFLRTQVRIRWGSLPAAPNEPPVNQNTARSTSAARNDLVPDVDEIRRSVYNCFGLGSFPSQEDNSGAHAKRLGSGDGPGSPESPDRSPSYMLRVMTSHQLPRGGLISPLPALLSEPFKQKEKRFFTESHGKLTSAPHVSKPDAGSVETTTGGIFGKASMSSKEKSEMVTERAKVKLSDRRAPIEQSGTENRAKKDFESERSRKAGIAAFKVGPWVKKDIKFDKANGGAGTGTRDEFEYGNRDAKKNTKKDGTSFEAKEHYGAEMSKSLLKQSAGHFKRWSDFEKENVSYSEAKAGYVVNKPERKPLSRNREWEVAENNDYQQPRKRSKVAESGEWKAAQLIKEARQMKHKADLLRDGESTTMYLSSALTFLKASHQQEIAASEGARQAEMARPIDLYNDTAKLCTFCAEKYEKQRDLAAAALSFICAALAQFRATLSKAPALSKDCRELHSVKTPSRSMVAMESWAKAHNAFLAAEAACARNPRLREGVVAVKKVGEIGNFGNMDSVITHAQRALGIIGH